MVLDCIDRVGRAQHGIVTRRDVLSCGSCDTTLDRWIGAGRLERLHPGVFRLAGSPRTWEQSLLGAVLASGEGAAASHRSAAILWKLLPADDCVEVTVPRPTAPAPAGAIVHRPLDLEPRHVLTHLGVPVTTPLRTMVDLGAVVPRWAVEDALDRGLVARLFTVVAVEAELDRLAKRGRRGAGVLREVLNNRALGRERADGLLEPRMARLLRRHGLPPAVFQHPVLLPGRTSPVRIDFAYPDSLLAIEVDGYETRSSPAALQRDLERQNALVGLGWTILRFTWADVVRRPESVARQIRSVLGRSVPTCRG